MGRALQLSHWLCQPSLQGGTGRVLRWWGSKRGSYQSESTKGILFEVLINVSDLFFFLSYYLLQGGTLV